MAKPPPNLSITPAEIRASLADLAEDPVRRGSPSELLKSMFDIFVESSVENLRYVAGLLMFCSEGRDPLRARAGTCILASPIRRSIGSLWRSSAFALKRLSSLMTLDSEQ